MVKNGHLIALTCISFFNGLRSVFMRGGDIHSRTSQCFFEEKLTILSFTLTWKSKDQLTWSPAGKGLTSWLSFVVSSVSLSLSHWYPGSGVVLDCIDS